MTIKDIADNMHGVKRIDGEYATKKEYRKHRKDEIMEEWYNKKEEADEKLAKIQDEKPLHKIFEEKEKLEAIDQKLYKNIEEFANTYGFKYGTVDRFKIAKIGRNIICNFIIERSRFLINSNIIAVPNCKGENDVERWFQENCNNIGLYIPMLHKKHDKLYMTGYSPIEGIDYRCKLVGSERSGFMYNENNHYIPHLDRHMDENQKKIFYKFCEFVGADSILIELEQLSDNFVKHKHSDLIDMIICYKKDKELDIPILELSHTEV